MINNVFIMQLHREKWAFVAFCSGMTVKVAELVSSNWSSVLEKEGWKGSWCQYFYPWIFFERLTLTILPGILSSLVLFFLLFVVLKHRLFHNLATIFLVKLNQGHTAALNETRSWIRQLNWVEYGLLQNELSWLFRLMTALSLQTTAMILLPKDESLIFCEMSWHIHLVSWKSSTNKYNIEKVTFS